MSQHQRVVDRIQALVARAAMNLPPRVQRLLAGKPIVRDGQQLSVETQLLLRLQQVAREPAVESLSIPEGRAAIDRTSAVVGGKQPIAAVRDLRVRGAEGDLPARLYTPSALVGPSRGPGGLLVFFHGGGMIYGGLASHDASCRFLAEEAGVQVLAVDYRLAPEAVYPAAVEDCAAAYAWAIEHATDLGADPDRIAVGGDSAGGYLSATTAIAAAHQGLPCAFQLLIYPVTDFVERSRSRTELGEGFFLTTAFMDLAQRTYFPAETDLADPRASVLRSASFPPGLAPAFVATAGFDPLRDEGEAYARLLADRGVAVEQQRYPGMIHGFLNMVGCGRDAKAANTDIARRLRAAIG